MGQKTTKDEVVENGIKCKECGEVLSLEKFYKYELAEPSPTCKSCKKKNRSLSSPQKSCCKCGEASENFYKRELVKENPTCKNCMKNNKKQDVMTGLYVITTLERSERNEYKVGKHTGSQRKLLSRYRTYLIDPIIVYFVISKNMDEFEKKILNHLTKINFKISINFGFNQ